MPASTARETGDPTAFVRDFFDRQYRLHRRYWWRENNRYSLDPADHTPFNGSVLHALCNRTPGRALDVGAGEGADAIRLAKLGYEVDALELSPIACEKIESFARAERVRLNLRNESALTASFASGVYDVVVMNGLLHYLEEKEVTLQHVSHGSAPGALHVISLFSTTTPLPSEHAVVPTFPDCENGVVKKFYERHRIVRLMRQRAKVETSHPGFSAHVHSYLKMIVELSSNGTKE